MRLNLRSMTEPGSISDHFSFYPILQRGLLRLEAGYKFCRGWLLSWLLLVSFLGLSAAARPADMPALSPNPFNAEAASRAYLDRISPSQKARSDAYFEGGYWLQLWTFLYGSGVAVLL